MQISEGLLPKDRLLGQKDVSPTLSRAVEPNKPQTFLKLESVLPFSMGMSFEHQSSQ